MEENVSLMKSMRFAGHILYHHFSIKESQTKVLFLLYKFNSMTQNDLMKYLDIKSGSLSELVTKLEKNQLITKVKSDEDKRKILLRLTPKGEEIAKGFEVIRENNADLLFKELTKEEKEQLQTILNKIIPYWKEVVKQKMEEQNND